MTVVDNLWYRADEAQQKAEQVYHGLQEEHDDVMEFTRTRHVSRSRFDTITRRILNNGLPFGAHTITHQNGQEILLVRHDPINKWVLPGGEVSGDESFCQTARRELAEEAGIHAEYNGLALLGRVQFYCNEYETCGVLPIFEAKALETSLTVNDPDEEITEAKWFVTLPEDTRDRDVLNRWRNRHLQR